MKTRTILCLIAAGLPALASADKINVKTGLWETTTTTDMSGMPQTSTIPPETLAKMPPEQRARIEAVMGARNAAGGHDHKSQSCVTEKDLERGFKPDQGRESECKAVSTKVDSSSQEVHMQCNGQKMKGTGVFRITIRNRESYEGLMEMNMTDATGEHPINMKMHMQGKWLSSDCGSVKSHD